MSYPTAWHCLDKMFGSFHLTMKETEKEKLDISLETQQALITLEISMLALEMEPLLEFMKELFME